MPESCHSDHSTGESPAEKIRDVVAGWIDIVASQKERAFDAFNIRGTGKTWVPLADIIDQVLRAKVGAIYPEGGNPRHEHEWRVFEGLNLPENMSVILGVIDTKSNFIEHPQVVADRLVRLANVIGPERVIAGTDCGFDTFIRFSQVDPDVAWLKLGALAEGAALATSQLN